MGISGCPHKTAKNVGLLALRVAIGVIFIYMGYSKLGPNHAGAAGLFEAIGFPGGGNFWAYFVGTFELVGGLMALFGAYLRFAAVWLSIIIVVAMLTVHRGGPFVGYFLPLSVLGGCLALLGAGAGSYRAVKSECFCKDCRTMCAEMGGGCGGKCGGSCGGDGGECGGDKCGGGCSNGKPDEQRECCGK